MINKMEIMKLIVDKGVTINDIALYLGKSCPNVWSKLTGRLPLSLWEAEKIQDILEIEDCDFGFYFLGHERGELCDHPPYE